MPKLLASAPVLLVSDVALAAAYYRHRLGFAYDKPWGDPPDFCMVRRDGLTVMLSQVPAGAAITPHWRVVEKMWSAYFWVSDLDALYEELRGRGAMIDYEPGMKAYGIREFGIQDVDGHDIGFGERIT